MESIYYPYTKKEAINILAQYYGMTKVMAKTELEKDIAYRYGKNMRAISERIAEMDTYLKEQAKRSFYED